jgi:transcriptional regulator with XRE-family HTH domain
MEHEDRMPVQLGGRSDLAAALTLLRLLRGVEQEALAGASGVSYALILKIEQGRRRPRAGALQAILRALEVEPAILDELAALVRRVRRGSVGAAAPVDGKVAGGGPGPVPPTPRDLEALQGLLRARLELARSGGGAGASTRAAPRRRVPDE